MLDIYSKSLGLLEISFTLDVRVPISLDGAIRLVKDMSRDFFIIIQHGLKKIVCGFQGIKKSIIKDYENFLNNNYILIVFKYF